MESILNIIKKILEYRDLFYFFIFLGIFATVTIEIIKININIFIRLGKNINNRKIIIFAESDNFNSLKNVLVDSKIFKEKNIEQGLYDSIKKYENNTFFIVYWKDSEKYFDKILNIKKDQTTLILYAPQSDGSVNNEAMNKLNLERNTILVNTRGRFLNDIFISMITNNYKKNK